MIFGKPPFTAKSIVELIKILKRTKFKLDKKCGLRRETIDVLEKMLVFDHWKWIDWDSLFNHPICIIKENEI